MEPEWESAPSGAVRTSFELTPGVRVAVSVEGGDPSAVREAAREIGTRVMASLEEGRFDVRKLGVRGALLALLAENKALNENLSAVQGRSSELINKARAWRKRLIELGDADPGPP